MAPPLVALWKTIYFLKDLFNTFPNIYYTTSKKKKWRSWSESKFGEYHILGGRGAEKPGKHYKNINNIPEKHIIL